MKLHEEIEALFAGLQGYVGELADDIEQGFCPELRIVEIGEIKSAQDTIEEIRDEDLVLGIDYWDDEYWEDISQILPYDDYPNDLNILELIQALEEAGEIQSCNVHTIGNDKAMRITDRRNAIAPIKELSAALTDIPESVANAFSAHIRHLNQKKDSHMDNRTLTLLGLQDTASCEEVYQA